MKKIILLLFSVVVVFILLAQIDDDLSDDANELLSRIDHSVHSEAYLYLRGIFAEEGEDPVGVGKMLFEEYQKQETEESYVAKDYPKSRKIPLSKGKAFCRLREEGCVEYLFSVDAEALIKEHKLLVYRLNTFLEYDEYRTLSKASYHEELPAYQYIFMAERIKILEAISYYKNGDAKKATDLLRSDFSKLRKSMELQDMLIGQMVFLNELVGLLDVMSIILFNEDIKTEMIPRLNQSEKSFYIVNAREFASISNTFIDLDKHLGSLRTDKYLGWIPPMLFKPNMSINAMTSTFIEDWSLLSPAEFEIKSRSMESIEPPTSWIRNYIGSRMVSIPSPDYTEFVARIMDLDVTISLFNQLHHLGLDKKEMNNPYYGKEEPEEKNGKLCFKGPLKAHKSMRCLAVTL